MRDIKFRFYGEGIKGEPPRMYDWNWAKAMCFSNLERDQYVWMQFTGLKDKNGVEIYEGDVLKETIQGYPTSKFDSTEIWSFTNMRELWHRLDPVVGWGHNEVEVIGNIYENPGLINLEVKHE